MPEPPIAATASTIIIGAGVSGLATARALVARGHDALVLEAAARSGGVIRSATVDGRVLEWGPQRLRLSPALRALVRELELEDELVIAPADLPLFIHRAGRFHPVPLSAAQLGRSRLLSTRAKLRVLAEPFTGRLRQDESVAAYVRRRFGSELYTRLLGPLIGGLYASDPERMPGRHALAPLLRQLGAERSALLALLRGRLHGGTAAAPPCSFRGGLQTLTDALRARLGDRVRLGEPTRALQRAGHELIVHTDRRAYRCAQVVLTVDAAAAATLIAPVDPAAAARLAALTYNELAIVHVVSDLRVRGMGFQLSFGEPYATRGVTFNDALFQRAGLSTIFLGGAREPSIRGRSDEEIAALARAEFRALTAVDARVLAIARARMPAWDASWAALDGFAPPAGVHLCANYESRPGVPGRFARAEQVADAIARAAPASGKR